MLPLLKRFNNSLGISRFSTASFRKKLATLDPKTLTPAMQNEIRENEKGFYFLIDKRCREGKLKMALQMWNTIERHLIPDAHNSLMRVFCISRFYNSVWTVYEDMIRLQIQPDIHTLSILLFSCRNLADVIHCVELFNKIIPTKKSQLKSIEGIKKIQEKMISLCLEFNYLPVDGLHSSVTQLLSMETHYDTYKLLDMRLKKFILLFVGTPEYWKKYLLKQNYLRTITEEERQNYYSQKKHIDIEESWTPVDDFINIEAFLDEYKMEKMDKEDWQNVF